MNKQALRMAIAECYSLIENNLGINMTARDKERIACGAFGLHIIDLLLSEQEEAGEGGDQIEYQTNNPALLAKSGSSSPASQASGQVPE